MPTPSPLAILFLLHAFSVFRADSDHDTVGDKSSATCWPAVNRNPPWGGLRGGLGYEHGDDCPRDEFLVPNFPKDLDMKKMMGRWFVGMVSNRHPAHNPRYRKCIIYEFGRLTDTLDTTSFNVTLTYQASTHKDRQSKIWKNPETIVGFMRSCGPINAKLMYKTPQSPHRLATKFFIYKVGPEGKDSFGRLQYEYAVVGFCKNYPVLVIVRNPATFNEKYKMEVVDWLDVHGILKFWDWIQPDYSNCSLPVTQDNEEVFDIRSEDAA